MSFGRRAFLQLAAGVVGGTLFTPLPWKLADDSAIWSQNWSWRPSPERGHVTKTPTTCVLCESGCGIQAHLVNGNRAIYLEGNPDHPISAGGICGLGAAGLQFMYAAYRVQQPLKQTKKRGDASGFQPIGWAEAIDELAGRFSRLKSEGKAHGIACITTQRQSSMDDLWVQLFKAYGSPNLFKMPSHADSLKLAASLATGQESPVAIALEKASYILSFGASLLDGGPAMGRTMAAFRDWRKDSAEKSAVKIVQVESRCSMTAAKADRWVAIAPGAEAALALGMAHVMVKEGLFDAAFVENSVFGFDDWTDAGGKSRKGFKSLVLSDYTLEKVAATTGIEAGKVRDLAVEFAAQKNAVAIWGHGSCGASNNIYHDMAFLALNVLKGNFKPGGLASLVPSVPLGDLPDVPVDASSQKRLDLAQGKNPPLPGNALHAFLDILAKAPSGTIDTLMVHEANPAYSLPENKVFAEALAKVGHLVSFSSYMDETARQADLILPSPTPFERFDDIVGIPGAPWAYYAVAAPVLKPHYDTKPPGDVLIELAKKAGGNVAAGFPWKSYEAFLQERVNGLAASGKGAVSAGKGAEPWKLAAGEAPKANYKDGTDLWKQLKAGKCWYDAPTDTAAGPGTASGKVELAFQALLANGVQMDDDKVYLPHFEPLKPSGSESELELQLVTCTMASLCSDYLANPPFMTKTLWDFILKENDLFVEVHPQTARKAGMSEGDRAVLKTPRGEAPVRVHLSPGARPGVIYMVQGLGHKAYDEYIQNKGVNANDMVEVQLDPITGLGTVWATRAQLRRA